MYGQHRNVPSSNDQLSYVDAGHLIASFPPYHPGPHPQHLPQHHATGYIPQQVHYQQAMPSSHPVQQIPVTYAPVYNPQLAYPPYGADSGFSAGTVARQPWAALPYQVSQPLVENRPVPAPSGQSHLVEQEVHNAQIGGRIGGGALSTQASLYAPRGEHQVTSDTNIQSILPLRPMVREDQNPAPQAIQSDSMHERNRPHNASLLGRVFRDVNERIQDIDYLESQRRETKPSSHPKVDVVDSNNSPNPNEPEKNPIEDHDARSTPSRSRDQSQACDAKYRLDASLDPTYRPKDGESTGPGVTLFTIARKSAIDSDGEESMQQTFVRRDRLSVIADEPEQRSDATPESFITLVRHYDKNGQLQINTLELQSPLLINLLNNEVRSPEIRPLEELESCLLREPFTALYWRLESLRRYADASGKDEEAHDAVQSHKTSCANTILDILEKNFYLITRSFGSWNSASRRDTVSFRELWMLYKPGTIVFIRLEDQPPFALRVDDVEYTVSLFEVPGPKMGPTRARGAGRPSLTPASLDHMSETASPLSITAWGIGHHKPGAHYDRKFGLQMYSIVINPYGGTRKISELPILPEKFTEPELRDRVSASGRIFWELTSARLREVTESSEYYQQDGERIIVDPSCLEPDSSNPSGPSQHPTRPLTREEMVLGSKHRNENVRTPLFVTSFATLYRTSEPASRFWMQKYGVIDPVTTPTQEMIYVCPPHIWGFSLRSRVWQTYEVRKLRPVQFQDNAWSRLVIAQEYKDVVQAMVNSNLKKSGHFEDIIKGKGGGVVILLHGPPGVGKTLTAESVAESVKKPLYMVTAGDLGTEPEQLELKLSEIFQSAARWDAILLLDEADIFLQDRDYDNLTRNALVSIFLRTLEYFQGIMFLTSNRVGVFDQAFQSRIHVTLGIPEFDEDTRKAVWKIFITDLGRKRQDGSDPLLSIDECKALGREVLNSWAREPLNGRQIRNCVRSALALAADKKEKVSAKHFNTVIRLGNTFTTYMNRLHKLRSDEIAQVKGDRLAEMRGLLEKSGTNANDPDDKTT